MEALGFWCLLFLAFSSAAPNSPRALQEEKSEQQKTAEAELEDHGNVLIELLAGYDRERDADCGCKCVVRVTGRSARPSESYTVQTVASRHGCKCACAATPQPAQQQPCEENVREKKLRQAVRENDKLLEIIDLLEDTFTKTNLLKLLKLSALTTELLERVANIERVLFQNQTTEKTKVESVPTEPEIRAVLPTSTPPPWQENKKKPSDRSNEAAAYQHTESKYEEKFVGGQLKRSGPGLEDVKALQEQEHHGKQQHPNLIVRGITYYKSDPVDETEVEDNMGEDESHSGDGSVDIFTEEELLPLSSPSFTTFTRSWPVSAKLKTPTQDSTTTQSVSKSQLEESDSSLLIKRKMFNNSGFALAKTFKSSTESFTKLGVSQSSATTDNFRAIWPTTHTTPQTLPGIEEEKEKTTSQMMLNMESTSTHLNMKSNLASSEMTRNIIPNTVAAVISQSEVTMKTLTGQTHNTETISRENFSQANDETPLSSATPSPMAQIQTTLIPETYSTTIADEGKYMKTNAGTTTTNTDSSNTGTTIILTTSHVTEGESDSSTTASVTTNGLASSTATTVTTGKLNKRNTHRISLTKKRQEPKQKIIVEDKEEKPQRQAEECKDTLATIAEPIAHNAYGRNEGAWMKDPMAHDNKIYVANYFYGHKLLEFQNMDVFKQGRFTNLYKLPYSWLGTGHAVYDGAFFFNRAFSRDIIKFDLRQQHVAAWTMLHDAALSGDISSWRWRRRSDVELAVDESGLWVIYAALDDEGYLQEVMVLSRLNPDDLSTQRETTWRTGLRRERYGNCFIVCGVFYATEHHGEQQENNLSYAFDTHTNTQMTPRLPFGNNSTYIAQIDYNPKERALYTWNNGHQITYDVVFAYVDPF